MFPSPELMALTAKYAVIVLSYAIIGGAIKYIDQAYDTGIFSRKFAFFLAIPTGLLMSFLMVIDPSSATIFLSILFAVGVTQKIDTPAFKVGVLILLGVPIFFTQYLHIYWLPLGFLAFAGIADEYGNDWADKTLNGHPKNSSKRPTGLKWLSSRMLLHRPAMKLILLTLVIIGFFHPAYIIAFLAFDATYSFIAWMSIRYKNYHLSSTGLTLDQARSE